MPNTNPPLDTPESINFILENQKIYQFTYTNWSSFPNQDGKELTEMALMKKEGAVAFSDDGLPIQDGSLMRTALEYSNLIKVPIINHAEDECLRENGLMNEGAVSVELGLLEILI